MKEIALYIHVPFCKQKCFYCDFPSYARKEDLMEEYINCLCKEIKEKCNNYKIKTLFIGGGTPSYLKENSLHKLMMEISKLNYSEGAERTIECNPGTLNEEKLELMKMGRINRLSFGLQTTKNELLKSIGRIHNFEDFKKNYFLAREKGFDNINIDMMFGLPKQRVEDYIESLKEVTDLKPEHISAYSLIIEEGTAFYKMYEKDILELPTEEEERDMYHKGSKLLEESGYKQYEISNYAKKGKECKHNIIYWKCEEYLGLGASSSSFIAGKRIKNIDDLRDYIKKINNNETVEDEVYINTEKDDMEEFMFMGLRMVEGIDEEDFKRRFSVEIDNVYKNAIDKNIEKGLLIRNGGKIYLSPLGIELSNDVMSDMIL